VTEVLAHGWGVGDRVIIVERHNRPSGAREDGIQKVPARSAPMPV
jgi:hypothetical protein